MHSVTGVNHEAVKRPFKKGDKSEPSAQLDMPACKTEQTIYSLYPNIIYLAGELLEIKKQISVQLYKFVN